MRDYSYITSKGLEKELGKAPANPPLKQIKKSPSNDCYGALPVLKLETY
jgi:hypothetical protein